MTPSAPRRWRAFVIVALAGGCTTAAQRAGAPRSDPPNAVAARDSLLARARQHFEPLAAVPPQDPARVALGRTLFFETGVSADGRVGCVTCHLPARWGTDGLARSIGVFQREAPFNAPTVLNAADQMSQHWRGDRASLEDEASRALLGPAAYGLSSNDAAVARLEAIPGYAEAFARAFPGDPTPVRVETWGAALAAYQRTLVTPAPIDRYLAGETTALTPPQREGLTTFIDAGCPRCHDGSLFGGRSRQRFGADVEAFKVPPLRNVTHTSPYFHDGSVASLDDAVARMAAGATGRPAEAATVARIVTFLGALAGEPPATFAPP